MAATLSVIEITTSDIAKSVAFYRELGIDCPQPIEGPHYEAQLANGLRIAWDDLEMVKGIHGDEWIEPQGQRMTLAFQCDSPGEVDSLHERLVAKGHTSKKAPWDAFWGQRYALVLDPDGNTVDLFASLP